MKIAAMTHFAVPFRNAGGETVLHQLLKALVEAGHEIDLWMTDCPEAPPYSEHEGIRIHSTKRHPLVAVQHIVTSKPDVVITQFHRAQLILQRARRAGLKTVYIAHNDMMGTHTVPLKMKPDLMVVNSDWVRASMLEKVALPESTIVIHPPLDARHRVPTTGDAVTMLNLNADKGSHVFYEMAERFPETKFLGVLGSHGQQVIRQMPNVEIVPNTPDLKPIWEQTKVVLMPSIYESYGLVAAEAGLSGIPTISAPTPGLVESRGKAGIHVKRDNLDGWEQALGLLLIDAGAYEEASEVSRKRSTALLQETTRNMKMWVSSVEGLVKSS